MIYVLDACAMLAYLKGEAGDDVVEAAMTDPANSCYAHAVNLCEVYYVFYRGGGESAADDAIADITKMSVKERNDFDESFWKEAGKLKAGGNIALPDCYAITLTNRVGGTLLSSDHNELDPIAAAGVCPITFIR